MLVKLYYDCEDALLLPGSRWEPADGFSITSELSRFTSLYLGWFWPTTEISFCIKRAFLFSSGI